MKIIIIISIIAYPITVVLAWLVDRMNFKKHPEAYNSFHPWVWIIPIINVFSALMGLAVLLFSSKGLLSREYWINRWKE